MMENIKITFAENGTKTLATAGKYCDRNIDVEVEVAGGGGGVEVEPIVLTGDCTSACTGAMAGTYIKLFGDTISTNNITNASQMFQDYKNSSIPFEINLANNAEIKYMFANNLELKTFPQVNANHTTHKSFQAVFQNCCSLREIPEWFVDLLEQDYNITTSSNTNFGPWMYLFQGCSSLRSVPDRAMKAMNNPNPTGDYYTFAYSFPFNSCTTLDELKNMSCDNRVFTSNQWSSKFIGLSRAKELTFATNEDGTPFIRQWKNQTISLSDGSGIGSGSYGSDKYMLNYNSGITADKQVTDDATYQALKDDPDWFTLNSSYSRFNHDSAVNTINSLPDTSAYLAANGGTNTIKFKGISGEKTDGGAINTLTEEEIAVATAKGWTVTVV